MQEALIGHIDVAAALDGLRRLSVNYDEADAPVAQHRGNWHVDNPRTHIAREPAGPPVPAGAWEIACELVRAYEFADPNIMRAVYRPAEELLGRDMLLEGRFLAFRFYLGVRVTEVVDEIRDGKRVWGWGYQTLEGHLEQGKLIYEGDQRRAIRRRRDTDPGLLSPCADRKSCLAAGLRGVRTAHPTQVLRRGRAAAAQHCAGDPAGRSTAEGRVDQRRSSGRAVWGVPPPA